MRTATGFYDRRGIPIHVGDLIRVPHFRHRRRGQLMWLYFRVAEIKGRFVVQHWYDLDAEVYQCDLQFADADIGEVLDGSERERNDAGEIVMWCERKRRKVERAETPE